MNLKTLLFDHIISKGIIKSDLKRHWMTPAVIGVLYLMFIYPEISIIANNSHDFADSLWYTDRGFIACSAAFILAGMLFSYLHKPSPVSFMHGMPVTRTQLFFSHYLTGFFLIILPVILLSLILGSIGTYGGEYFMATTAAVLVIYSVVTAVSVVVGNRFAAYILSLALMIFPLYITGISDYFFDENVYGYIGTYDILGVLYKDFGSLTEPLNFITYVIIAIGFTTLALVLYKFRDLENSNEMIAFSWIRPIFVFLAAFCFGSFAYMVSGKSVIISFIIGFAAVAVSFMLIKKSVTFKGSSIYILSYIILFVGVFIAGGFAINFMNKAPSRINIREAYLSHNTSYGFLVTRSRQNPAPIKLKNSEIQMLLDIQNDVIETMKNDEDQYGPSIDLTFVYDLNIGGRICRSYSVSKELARKHKEFFNTEAFAKYKFGFIDVNIKDIDSITISSPGHQYNGERLGLGENKNAAVIEAFKKDIAEHIEDGTFFEMAADTIDAETATDADGYVYLMEVDYHIGDEPEFSYVYIPKNFKNTVKEIERNFNRF